MSQNLAYKRYGLENGDRAARAAWLVLHPSGRGLATSALLHTSIRARLTNLCGVRTMFNSKKTSPQGLTVRIKDCKNSGDFLQLLSQHGAAFDHIHVGAAWSKFKSMQRKVDRGTRIEVVRTLQELTESQMPKMEGRGVANILHAIAKAKAADTASMKQLVQKLMAKAASVTQSFATLWWPWPSASGRVVSCELCQRPWLWRLHARCWPLLSLPSLASVIL